MPAGSCWSHSLELKAPKSLLQPVQPRSALLFSQIKAVQPAWQNKYLLVEGSSSGAQFLPQRLHCGLGTLFCLQPRECCQGAGGQSCQGRALLGWDPEHSHLLHPRKTWAGAGNVGQVSGSQTAQLIPSCDSCPWGCLLERADQSMLRRIPPPVREL